VLTSNDGGYPVKGGYNDLKFLVLWNRRDATIA
jgi:hypothetical protein